MRPIQRYVYFVERLKHTRVTRRKTFLHTNLHRAKNQKRKVCVQPIHLFQDVAERAFPKLFFFLFFVHMSTHCGIRAAFIGLGRSSGIESVNDTCL